MTVLVVAADRLTVKTAWVAVHPTWTVTLPTEIVGTTGRRRTTVVDKRGRGQRPADRGVDRIGQVEEEGLVGQAAEWS